MKPPSRRERVMEALGDGQKTAHQIAYAIHESPVDISSTLCGLRKDGKVRVVRSERVRATGPKAHTWEKVLGGGDNHG